MATTAQLPAGLPASTASAVAKTVTAADGRGWHAPARAAAARVVVTSCAYRIGALGTQAPRPTGAGIRGWGPMTTIAAVCGAIPEHRYEQPDITAMFGDLLSDASRVGLLRRVHASAGVRTRHLVLPL